MKKKFSIGCLGVVFCLIYFAVAMTFLPITYAWYTGGKYVSFNSTGTAVASYFAGGTGTATDPYKITTPRHVYNLAWLQYLGMFNETVSATDNTLKTQYYFSLENDINMADSVYQIIPPIGTMENPFVGNFNGQGHTISNVIVANKKNTSTNQTTPPTIITSPPAIEQVRYSEIIGFFGVIGEYDGSVTVTKTGDDSQLANLGVSNLNLENITVATSTNTSLAGLFAGFVNGTVKDINILSGEITTAANVQALTGEVLQYPAKDDAGNPITGNFTVNEKGAISMFSIIGDYFTTLISWLDGPLNGPTSDSGQNEGFGGSIDTLSLSKRISYMMAAGYVSATFEYDTGYGPDTSVQQTYNLYGITGDKYKNVFDFTSTSEHQIFSFLQGACLPLNINGDYITKDHYSEKKAEVIASAGNTGYIVGENKGVGTGLSIKTYLFGQLFNSLQGSSSGWTGLKYSETVDASLQILTKNVEGKYFVISEGSTSVHSVYSNLGVKSAHYENDLNFTQYRGENDVRSKLSGFLNSAVLHGLQFSASIPNANSVISNNVVLGSNSVESLVQGTIHFSVENSGVITLVAGTFTSNAINSYTSWGGDQYLPMLYKVVRDETTKKIIRLDDVYRIDVNGNTYTSKDTVPSGTELVYDYATMGKLCGYNDEKAYCQSLFYFEIPVKKGEYVFGGSGQPQAFVLYLDIGANAGTEGGDDSEGGPSDEQDENDRTISGVGFAYYDTASGKYVRLTCDNDGNPTFAVEGANVLTYQILRSSSGSISVSFTPSSSGLTPISSNTATVTPNKPPAEAKSSESG